jgi:hypothetical protein
MILASSFMPVSRVGSTLLWAAALVVCLARTAQAAGVEDSVAEVQRDWEVIRYQVPAAEREKKFEALATKAHQVSEAFPGRSEPLIWEGIVVSSVAGEKGGLGALGLVKQAKALYEAAIQLDGAALEGSAYNSLGVLYYKVPAGPSASATRRRPASCCRRRCRSTPAASTPTFSTASISSRASDRKKQSPTSNAPCRRRRGRDARSPMPVVARKRAPC